MAVHVSYTEARARLAELIDKAEEDRAPIIITRRGKPVAALISAEEFERMEEGLHLFSSPRNATRIYEAIERLDRGEGEVMTVEELRRQVTLDE